MRTHRRMSTQTASEHLDVSHIAQLFLWDDIFLSYRESFKRTATIHPTSSRIRLPLSKHPAKNPAAKTEMCERGDQCPYGNACSFAHSVSELRSTNPPELDNPLYKTQPCRDFHRGTKCLYGSKCKFYHEKSEKRHYVPPYQRR